MLTEHDCKISPSTYYVAKKRAAEPSARQVRDASLKELIREVHAANFRVYGARKIWRELHRRGHAGARCTVERLMRELGITGAVRGKKVITTIPDSSVERAPDLLDRKFVAPAPNRCWVAGFTYVSTWSGVVYVASAPEEPTPRRVTWPRPVERASRAATPPGGQEEIRHCCCSTAATNYVGAAADAGTVRWLIDSHTSFVGLQVRSTLRLRKWAEHEMHGS
ncbi:IS3 family transposase [Streptomyces sp. NPDC001880]